MADYSMVMPQAEVSALKETLCAQQQLLQELYNELDAEREASATAASEALSVILRLQVEKAAVKMEAEQYKRLSEEKMCYAEESLAIIEDIIYQKDMEVAALDYQVQAYRCKLLSMGCFDPGVGETKFPENILQRNEKLAGETIIQSLGRRNSVPHLLKYKKVVHEKESFMSTEELMGGEINEKSSDSDRKIDKSIPGDISSYWEQIRKLDSQVKEIAGDNNTNFKNDPSSLSNETCSPSPQLSTSNGQNEDDPIKSFTNLSKNCVAFDYSCPPSVHDVFEVPQVDKNLSSCEPSTKDSRKTLCHGSECLESVEYSRHSKLYSELCKPSEIAGIDCHLAIVQTSTNVSESQPRQNQLNMRSEIIEIERTTASSTNREDELKLLKEIKEEVNSLHDEIRSLKIKKQHKLDEPSFHLLAEAMIYFWL